MKRAEHQLITHFAKLVGVHKLTDNVGLAWLEQVRRLPAEESPDELCACMTWAITKNSFWSKRIQGMKEFVDACVALENNLLLEYRAKTRKIAEDGPDCDTLKKLREQYDTRAMRSEIFYDQLARRLTRKKIELSKDCPDCKGRYSQNLRTFAKRKNFQLRRDCTDLDCKRCMKIAGPMYQEIFNQLKEEVYGK